MDTSQFCGVWYCLHVTFMFFLEKFASLNTLKLLFQCLVIINHLKIKHWQVVYGDSEIILKTPL